MSFPEYITLVDRIAIQIDSGALKPGDKLPPQRTFAYENDIAVSTAGRVYAELLRRGLVVGEVGRGTFVAGRTPKRGTGSGVPHEGRIDFEFNFPMIPEQAGLIAACLAGLQRADVVGAAMAPVTQRRLAAAGEAAASFHASAVWQPRADQFVFTGSGRQSLASAISALVPTGGRLAVEAISYPRIKNIAARLAVTLVPIAMDEQGVQPDALAKAHRTGALSALYLQPVMHNPLGHTMPATRRADIIRLADQLGLTIIEDVVYGFLSDTPPLAAEAPDSTIVIDSFSKRVAPGAAFGTLHVPYRLREQVARAVRAGAWLVSPLGLELGERLMRDGTAAELTRLKRVDAEARQRIVSACLGGFDVVADPHSYHAWLRLPDGWRSEPFAAVAARAGVAITPSSAFAMTSGHAPNAVRLAFGLPSHEDVGIGLKRIAELLRTRPDDAETTE